MTKEELILRGIDKELVYTASRSSGPGGQNVNKVNTKVELRFNISHSSQLTDSEKDLIYNNLRNRITSEGEILLSCQSGRSQVMNKREVTAKFFDLLAFALTPEKSRMKTKPALAVKLKRLNEKRARGEIKKLRRHRGQIEE
jgi:ribosome-associated protein